MATVRLYENSESVGYVDADTGETAYRGDDRAVDLLLREVNGGLTEVVRADGTDGSRTRTVTGDELVDHVVGVLEELGVHCRVEDEDR